MSTPGFRYINRDVKSDGTRERIELNAAGFALKKYTRPDGTSFSSVQSPRESHTEFERRARSTDPMTGFRSLFGNG